ncbi:helix-turn-helix domain-containing protein [Nonomuraea sp. SBT364]|uniref:helix-turn-helix domain-containing protein n=1 Tax=Nonomuraea sp. SBT364 TaxID=1580530 RepID=UPI00066CB1CB|nr:helix-turn-helix transcriptional regulator [Nonomuraea sp. SBT364]
MTDSGPALARRLRSLRTRQWPGTRVTQPQLARALDVSVPLISSWESSTAPKVPPAGRLEVYAALFCTPRSLRGDDLVRLGEDDLTAEELRLREKLLHELLTLRAAALGAPGHAAIQASQNPWQFDDGRQITLVCGRLPPDLLARMPYVNPDDPDYIELYTYADLDALFELHGHIRACNPGSEVRRRTSRELEPDDLTAHLVLLGGVDWNEITTDVFYQLGLPVTQHSDWDTDDGVYFEAGADRFRPKLSDGRLHEDVALFYRGPNPLNHERTLTICNGMYGRGTLGVARALTDGVFRDRNAAFLRERFGDSRSFAILSRVLIMNGLVITPDWTVQESRLVEWPE